MEHQPTKAEKRQGEILSRLAANGVVSLGELCQALGCSESTVRNDLSYLEERGALKRTFGGAIPAGMAHLGRSMSVRADLHKPEKRAIAQYITANILRPGNVVTLDSGSTCIEIAQAITESDPAVSVITNNFPAAVILTKAKQVELYLAGGHYHRGRCALDDIEFLKTLQADYFFFAVNGVSASVGFTIPDADEVYVKRAMMSCAARTVAVVDSSKLGNVGFKVVCGFERVNCLITDSCAEPGQLARLRETGLQVLVAPSCETDP